MNDQKPVGVAVCAPTDPVIANGSWRRISPPELGEKITTIHDGAAFVGGERVGALYWAPPFGSIFSADYAADEQAFVDQELLSLWSAVAAAPDVRCNIPGLAFHGFQSSRWLYPALATDRWPREPRADDPRLWLAHMTEEPIRADELAMPGATGIGDETLFWFWTAGPAWFPEVDCSSAAREGAARWAADLSAAGFGHMRLALTAAGDPVAATPFPESVGDAIEAREVAAAAFACWCSP